MGKVLKAVPNLFRCQLLIAANLLPPRPIHERLALSVYSQPCETV